MFLASTLQVENKYGDLKSNKCDVGLLWYQHGKNVYIS